MPRRKSNARQLCKPKKLKAQILQLPIECERDEISPGKLVAAAEYKVVEV
jgi:hypothetical protein